MRWSNNYFNCNFVFRQPLLFCFWPFHRSVSWSQVFCISIIKHWKLDWERYNWDLMISLMCIFYKNENSQMGNRFHFSLMIYNFFWRVNWYFFSDNFTSPSWKHMETRISYFFFVVVVVWCVFWRERFNDSQGTFNKKRNRFIVDTENMYSLFGLFLCVVGFFAITTVNDSDFSARIKIPDTF